MQYLIGQVQLLGATAIVFDSAPSADISFGGNNLTDLSNGYAGALYDMFEESQQ